MKTNQNLLSKILKAKNKKVKNDANKKFTQICKSKSWFFKRKRVGKQELLSS